MSPPRLAGALRARFGPSLARPLRYNVPGGIYHVTSRGNERRAIVRADADRLAFVDRLADVVLDRGWLLHSWVLMTNHLHLIVETPVPNLPEGMRDLLGPFAQRFNAVHRRVGHLVQHRYGAKVIERETHLLENLRYVPLNPVRAGIVATPAEWIWGSYRATAGFEPAPPWLEVDWTLDQFDRTDRVRARLLFREFVSQPRDVEYDPDAEAVGGWILGSAAFCEKIQSWIDGAARSSAHPKRQRRLVLARLDVLIEIVRRETGAGDGDLAPGRRGAGRKLIADLGHDECGLTFEAIAVVLGTTGWGAGKLRRRSRELASEDPDYAALRERIRDLLRR
jgi:putative transposase